MIKKMKAISRKAKRFYISSADFILEKAVLVKLVILANLFGTAFGFYWYRDLLMSQKIHLWPLIPDSPIATLAISVSLILFLLDNRNEFLDTFAFVSNVKYGVWTVFVQLYMFEMMLGSSTLGLYIFITFSHLMMFLQAFIILRYAELSLKPVLGVLTWFLLNDFVDYSLGVHASLPVEVPFVGVVSGVAVFLTIFSVCICVLLIRVEK